jgi:hypothetical protein
MSQAGSDLLKFLSEDAERKRAKRSDGQFLGLACGKRGKELIIFIHV